MKTADQLIEFKYMGSKYRTTPDLNVIERQSSMNGRWALTHSLAVRAAAQEAVRNHRGVPML